MSRQRRRATVSEASMMICMKLLGRGYKCWRSDSSCSQYTRSNGKGVYAITINRAGKMTHRSYYSYTPRRYR